MGEKRGKYMQYNNDTTKKSKVAHIQHLRNTGRGMYDRVAAERCKHFIGEKMVLNRRAEKDFGMGPTVEGRVIGIYPHFLLLHCGNYKSTVSYMDLILGGKIYV